MGSRRDRERETEKKRVGGRAEACGIGKLPGNLFVSRFEPLLNNYCVLFHLFSLSSPTLLHRCSFERGKLLRKGGRKAEKGEKLRD